MHLTERHTFNAAPLAVYAMSTDPVFLERACRELGALEQSVSVSGDPDAATATVEMVAETVPALAALAGGTLRFRQEMVWGPAAADGSRDARVSISVAGLPVTLAGTAHLAPAASGSTVDYDGDFTIAVPFLGPTLEKQALPFVTEVLASQQNTGNAWLAEHPA